MIILIILIIIVLKLPEPSTGGFLVEWIISSRVLKSKSLKVDFSASIICQADLKAWAFTSEIIIIILYF